MLDGWIISRSSGSRPMRPASSSAAMSRSLRSMRRAYRHLRPGHPPALVEPLERVEQQIEGELELRLVVARAARIARGRIEGDGEDVRVRLRRAAHQFGVG